jgi:hypothetical protein
MNAHLSIKLSEIGRTFDGKKLNDDNLYSGDYMIYKNNFYFSGNRHNDEVELFTSEGTFYMVVKMSKVKLLKIEIHLI